MKDVRKGLVGQWLINGSMLDQSGNGNDITNYGIVYKKGTKGMIGRFNNASHGAVGDICKFGTGDFTISTWIREDISKTIHEGIFSKGTYNTAGGFVLYLFGGDYPTFYVDTKAVSTSTNWNGFDDNKWRHVICQKEGDVISIYNGATLRKSETHIGLNVDATQEVRIGCRDDGTPDEYFDGYLFDVRVYDRVLTYQEKVDLNTYGLYHVGKIEQKTNFIKPKPTDLSKEVDSKVGDTLVINGDFSDGSSGWTVTLPWSILNGKANYDLTSNNYISTSIPIISGRKYVVSFDILDLTTGGARLAFANELNQPVFKGGSYVPYQLGRYSDILTAENDATDLRIFAQNSSGSAFAIDNISVQEVSGLVAAYNMIPSKGKLIDISGNGNDGTIVNAISTKDGMYFKPENSKITFSNPGFVDSEEIMILARVKSNDYTHRGGVVFTGNSDGQLIGVRDNKLHSYIGNTLETPGLLNGNEYTIAITFKDGTLSQYINGVLGSILTGQTYLVSSDWLVGQSSTIDRSFGGDIIDVKICNYVDEKEIKDYHNSFQEITLRETFSDAGADGINKKPRGWQ